MTGTCVFSLAVAAVTLLLILSHFFREPPEDLGSIDVRGYRNRSNSDKRFL